jgi:hypothetical protein
MLPNIGKAFRVDARPQVKLSATSISYFSFPVGRGLPAAVQAVLQ